MIPNKMNLPDKTREQIAEAIEFSQTTIDQMIEQTRDTLQHLNEAEFIAQFCGKIALIGDAMGDKFNKTMPVVLACAMVRLAKQPKVDMGERQFAE